MDKFPEFYRSMSHRLFAVMDAIGVSEDIVYRRRHAYLKQESMRSIFYQLSEINIKTYHFGSQTEGTTTPEMDSDLDTLDCQQNFNVITDNSYWKTGKENMSIIQNDLTPPGHCRLHEVDFLSESEDYPHEECLFDEENRLILPNTFAVNVEKSAFEYLGFGYERHGPSGSPFPDKDIVNGFLCSTWPLDSSLWLGRPRALHWLSSEVIAEVLEGGCFIVSVGHPESENEKVEWRVSFSKSERVLTFNINITQIKCYVLLKLIKNEVLKLIAGDQFTSYHCKLVLLFTIERLPTGLWVSENLLSCLFMCLKTMQMFFISGYCPHVFNPAVNLFAGKITLNVRLNLLTCITSIINDDVRCLLSLKSDSLGNLLALFSSRVNIRSMTCSSDSALKTEKLIIGKLAYDEHVSLCGDLFSVLSYTIKPEHSVQECIKRIINHMKNSLHYFTNGDSYEKASAQMFVAYLCSFLASLYVAYSKDHVPKFVYSLVDVLYKLSESSLGIDVASSKLKLATLYYHKGDLQKASYILKTIENMFENHVTPICGNCDCNDSPHKEFVIQFSAYLAKTSQKRVLHTVLLFCDRNSRAVHLHSDMRCIDPPVMTFEIEKKVCKNGWTGRK
ncbi:uncharacterized protein LOC123548464 [Mercenaria mercenaria]|uniref:uncharacterized protein LOC123548464 n=1 Tax=Mercenaria mercenaria TaxID=6596 RepID=UPI00234F63F8|nr:uncharacterized protein LOC123548464 [Mercenaria mercenaria]